MTERLPRFERGKPIYATDLNATGADLLRGRIRGGRGILVKEVGGNYVIESSQRIPGRSAPILARITGVAALGSKTSQWVYTITQVKLTVTASGGTPSAVSIADVDGGIDGAKALNVAELRNVDAGIAFGTDQAGSDYPAGFAPKPISGGGTTATHQQDVLVYVVGRVKASDDSTIYLIDRMGTHDGGCEE